jgi:hypothetical protein
MRRGEKGSFPVPGRIEKGGRTMVLAVTDEELLQMKMVVMDGDKEEALHLLREFVKRLEQQKNLGMKSHLD